MISQNSELVIKDSIFKDNYSLGIGSIIFAENKGASASITNANFEQNYAKEGGVFYSQFDSKILCHKCNFT